MEILLVAVRWLHTVATLSLVGVFACSVLVVRPAARSGAEVGRERLRELDAQLLKLAGWALAVAVIAGMLDLWRQVGVATGAGAWESLDGGRILSVLADTRYGTVWLARTGLLVLLAALLLLAEEEAGPGDWLALRLQALGLSAASLVLGAAAGHAAAVEGGALAMGLDGLHLLASGAWAGGLVPLVLCLAWARRLPSHAVAARATEAFSRVGLGAVTILAATGTFAAWQHVGGVPALLGTAYGRWLILKLVLFGVLLPVAARNLLVWRRRLAAGGPGTPEALTALRRHALAEAILTLAIVAVVAVLGLTTPGRHDEIAWPLTFRLDWEATKTLPGVQPRVAIGSQVATLGLVALLLALVIRPRRWRAAALGGGIALALGATLALRPMAVDAHPTTYLRPAVPYAAASIVQGQNLYRIHCQSCHGVAGYGDGPAGAGLPRRPADLTAKHAADHTAGDLFWWLTHGIPGSGMPGFADQLAVDARWDVINFVRALGAAERARDLGPIATVRPAVVAPDFTFTTGIGEGRALRDWRGRGIVLVAFFTLPASADRLVELNRLSVAFKLRGGEILGVPLDAEGGVYRALGGRPVFFPLAVEGAAEAGAAYMLFRRDLTPEGLRPEPPPVPHMELLVDRQGYLRARWVPRDLGSQTEGWADVGRLLAQIDRLAQEVPVAPLAAEHVH
ncbi:MAG TPA: CopD family protein [Methylomirabilota bacterium]|nr:CopD family protein [Methylomirabilota bacterium]